MYIQTHSEAEFTHSMCPECSDELYGTEDWYIDMKNEEKEKELLDFTLFFNQWINYKTDIYFVLTLLPDTLLRLHFLITQEGLLHLKDNC